MTHSRTLGTFILALVMMTPAMASAAAAQRGNGGAQRAELQDAREQLRRDQAEKKRLQTQLKRDRQARDQAAVKHDGDLIKDVDTSIRRDQDKIRELSRQRGGDAPAVRKRR